MVLDQCADNTLAILGFIFCLFLVRRGLSWAGPDGWVPRNGGKSNIDIGPLRVGMPAPIGFVRPGKSVVQRVLDRFQAVRYSLVAALLD